MRGDLHDILAGVAVRAAKHRNERLIEHGGIHGVTNRYQLRDSIGVWVETSGHAMANVYRITTTYTNDRDSPSSRWGRDRSNRVLCSWKIWHPHGPSGENESLTWLENPHPLTVLITREAST